ncbi:MAG: GNAT family N-acetyltransferase [Kiloniellales bacterium]|nr:GNAT family N-acetyltransferase [Kiloniellales bacterium]
MKLREAKAGDLDFITELENRPEYLNLVYRWPRDRHLASLKDPDLRYLICEDERAGACGFAILCGLSQPERTVKLQRVAVATPGRGQGSALLRAVTRLVFDELGAHRFWLGVYADNARARAAYRGLGFVEEGTLRDGALRADGFVSLVLMSILEQEYRAGAV